MKNWIKTLGVVIAAVIATGITLFSTGAFAGNLAATVALRPGNAVTVTCPNALSNTSVTANAETVNCAATSTTTTTTPPPPKTTPPTTTTTTPPPPKTTPPATGGNCTSPIATMTGRQTTTDTDNGTDWVNSDEWWGTTKTSVIGPQTVSVCSKSSWTVTTTQGTCVLVHPATGGKAYTTCGAVKSYPDTEYDVGGRNTPSKTKISGYKAITSTFAEVDPTTGNYDSGYDLWTTNWGHETMIWNQYIGGQTYWYDQAKTTATLGGVAYKVTKIGSTELAFFRVNQVSSGSVNLLAAWQWEVAHGYAKANQVPTQIEYGVEICGTGTTAHHPTSATFAVTGFGVTLTP